MTRGIYPYRSDVSHLLPRLKEEGMTSWIARRRIAVGMLSLCAFAGFAPRALAQETRATVTGTVSDTQGSVVPGVTVTVLNTDTNVSYEGTTNEAGVFTVQRRSTRAGQGDRGACPDSRRSSAKA